MHGQTARGPATRQPETRRRARTTIILTADLRGRRHRRLDRGQPRPLVDRRADRDRPGRRPADRPADGRRRRGRPARPGSRASCTSIPGSPIAGRATRPARSTTPPSIRTFRTTDAETMLREPDVAIEAPAIPASVPLVRDLVVHVCRSLGVTPSLLDDVALAVTEAAANSAGTPTRRRPPRRHPGHASACATTRSTLVVEDEGPWRHVARLGRGPRPGARHHRRRRGRR